MLDQLIWMTQEAGPLGLVELTLGMLGVLWVAVGARWRPALGGALGAPLSPVALQVAVAALGCVLVRRSALRATLMIDQDARVAALASALDRSASLPVITAMAALPVLWAAMLATSVSHVGTRREVRLMLSLCAIGVAVPLAGGLWLQQVGPLLVGAAGLLTGARTAEVMTRSPQEDSGGQFVMASSHAVSTSLAAIAVLALSQRKGFVNTSAVTVYQKQVQRASELLDLHDLTLLLYVTAFIGFLPALFVAGRDRGASWPLLFIPLIALLAWSADPSWSVGLRLVVP